MRFGRSFWRGGVLSVYVQTPTSFRAYASLCMREQFATRSSIIQQSSLIQYQEIGLIFDSTLYLCLLDLSTKEVILQTSNFRWIESMEFKQF